MKKIIGVTVVLVVTMALLIPSAFAAPNNIEDNPQPSGEIISPTAGSIVNGEVTFEATYSDDDPSSVSWAVRQGTCAAATNTIIGNVDGHHDIANWDGQLFKFVADTSGWENGQYCFVFNPTEGTGEDDVRETQFFVVNYPPVADPDGPYLAAVNTKILFNGTSSTDVDDEFGQLSFAWDFGDGSTGEGAEATHSYSEAKIYNVCLTVTDSWKAEDTACTVAVVYDPAGGFVTGGGWIWSPEGAYTADLDLVGKASFGFVSKYKKGADVPTGETEFKFQAGDLNFHSSSYEWLVVAGAKAQYKGFGTINGMGEYGFMLTAIDGDLKGDGIDMFRIKIWDKAMDTIVYDNQMDAEDTVEPSTVLGGGSIVVHKEK